MLRIGFLGQFILSSTLSQTLSSVEGSQPVLSVVESSKGSKMTKKLLFGVAKQSLSAGGIRLGTDDFFWR